MPSRPVNEERYFVPKSEGNKDKPDKSVPTALKMLISLIASFPNNLKISSERSLTSHKISPYLFALPWPDSVEMRDIGCKGDPPLLLQRKLTSHCVNVH